MTRSSAFVCLFALSVLEVAKGRCHQDESVVIKMCQTGVLTGSELFVDVNVTIGSNELCSCTVRHTLSGNMLIQPITGSTALECGVQVNFHKTLTSNIYSVYCLTDYAYSDFVEANNKVTFNITGSGRMNTCINMESLVQNSLLTVECTEIIQLSSTVAPPTTKKPPIQKPSTQPSQPSTQPPKPSSQPPKPSSQPPKPSSQPPKPTSKPSSQPPASSPLPTATTTPTTNPSENPTQPSSKSTERKETLQTTIFPFQATRSDILVVGLSLGCGMLILFVLVIALIIYIRRHVSPRDRLNKTRETLHVVGQTVPQSQVTSPHDYANAPDVTGDATSDRTYSKLFTEEQTKNVYEKIEDTSFTTIS